MRSENAPRPGRQRAARNRLLYPFECGLINVRNDSHVWAEAYDRDLEAVFAIQSEIAQKVAEQLHAKISTARKKWLLSGQQLPILPLSIFIPAHARIFPWQVLFALTGTADLLPADPRPAEPGRRAAPEIFSAAYCQMARTHAQIYLLWS